MMTPHTITIIKPGGRRYVFRFTLAHYQRLRLAVRALLDGENDFDELDALDVAMAYRHAEDAALESIAEKVVDDVF